MLSPPDKTEQADRSQPGRAGRRLTSQRSAGSFCPGQPPPTPPARWGRGVGPEGGGVAVIIPTYNERGNVEGITARLRAAVPDAELLVVDDNSPDGTGEIADKLAASDPAIHVLHRPGKAGLGAAYIAGFGWALER